MRIGTRTRTRTATALAVLLAAGVAPQLLSPAPASAAAAKYGDDFDGDGHRDYVTSWNDNSEGGGVRITYGTADGPGTRTQVITQASPGVYGADETDDMFGAVHAAADLDGDGYGDLAVTALGEDVGSHEDQGAVTVLWGSRTGLKGGAAVPNKAPGDYNAMGSDLATGDFTGDGKQDLAVVNNGKTYLYRGGITRSGTTGSVTTLAKTSTHFAATALIAGKVNGDSKTDLVIIGDSVTSGTIASDAWFIKGGATPTPGKTLRLESQSGNGGQADRGGDGLIADFDKDGYGDIAIGTPLYSHYKGRVSVWYGSSSGPATSARFTQSTSGVAGTPEADDWFGESLSAGDVNGDGYPELAVGVRGEAIDGKDYAGGVHILKGRSSGLTGTGSQWFARNSSGVPGALKANDEFGAIVRLRDLDRDKHADLYVSGLYGGLRLPGTSSGITAQGATPVDDDLVEMLPE